MWYGIIAKSNTQTLALTVKGCVGVAFQTEMHAGNTPHSLGIQLRCFKGAIKKYHINFTEKTKPKDCFLW